MKFSRTKSFGAKLLSGVLSLAMILSNFPTSMVYANETPSNNTEVVSNLTDEEIKDVILDNLVYEDPVDPNVNSIPQNDTSDYEVDLEVDTPPKTDDTIGSESDTTQDTDGTSSTIIDNPEVNNDDSDTSESTDPSDSTESKDPANIDTPIDTGDNESTDPIETIEDSGSSDTSESVEDGTDDSGTETPGEGTTGEGTSGEDTTGEDTTGEGTTGEGTTGEGTTGEDTTGEGTTDEGTTDEGTTGESTTGEGTETPGEGTTGESTTGEGTETPGEGTLEEDPEPVITYNYSIELPDELSIVVNHKLDITSIVTANKVVDDNDPEELEYSFKYSVSFNGQPTTDTFEDDTNPITSITFSQVGTYNIVAELYDSEGTIQYTAFSNVTVEEDLPVIEFDHYYTTFDTSLVNTAELLIKTSNPSVFTLNTNVVSNFDDVYVISCSSIEEARYVYSYYVDKVEAISDMSNVFSLSTDENAEDTADLDNLNEDSNDAIAQLSEIVPETYTTDYSDYIALIDTGANTETRFAVVGNSADDTNGHGTQMLNYIMSENPNAKVISIKVFEGSTTSAANLYAGIKLAIEARVKVINLSLVGANTEKNAIVSAAIQEALDAGIIVIGAAGNYNIDAKNFIPGCIDGVITVGAIKDDYYKHPTSNYGADRYVIATSTSEATARFTGIYTSGQLDDPETDIWTRVRAQCAEETIHDDKKAA